MTHQSCNVICTPSLRSLAWTLVMDCLFVFVFVFLVVGAITSITLLGTGCHTILNLLDPIAFALFTWATPSSALSRRSFLPNLMIRFTANRPQRTRYTSPRVAILRRYSARNISQNASTSRASSTSCWAKGFDRTRRGARHEHVAR
jgi:hypothetical protein